MGERAASRVLHIISGLQVFTIWMQWAGTPYLDFGSPIMPSVRVRETEKGREPI